MHKYIMSVQTNGFDINKYFVFINNEHSNDDGDS